ncbi:MAG: hypothetical protein GX131_01640 [candidate division WS1 bacterium]|jgi:2',3'-cyclic-nucleotide 2'-phosphodiesterase (5'-nucleotidase family)|nr:hypothetical protein [candidate division WS1 bacterium]
MTLAVMLVAGAAFAQGTASTELTTANAQRTETTFGDLAADALASAAGTPLALVPAVSFKSGTIPAGAVTAELVRELLTQPSETWAVVTLTGAELRETLERSVSRAPQPNGGFLQVSGLTLTYDPAQPRNARITSLSIGGATVQPDANYQVAMPLSLAKGGSGYFTIFGEADIARNGSSEMATVIVDYVAGQGSVSYTGRGRINVAG